MCRAALRYASTRPPMRPVQWTRDLARCPVIPALDNTYSLRPVCKLDWDTRGTMTRRTAANSVVIRRYEWKSVSPTCVLQSLRTMKKEFEGEEEEENNVFEIGNTKYIESRSKDKAEDSAFTISLKGLYIICRLWNCNWKSRPIWEANCRVKRLKHKITVGSVDSRNTNCKLEQLVTV